MLRCGFGTDLGKIRRSGRCYRIRNGRRNFFTISPPNESRQWLSSMACCTVSKPLGYPQLTVCVPSKSAAPVPEATVADVEIVPARISLGKSTRRTVPRLLLLQPVNFVQQFIVVAQFLFQDCSMYLFGGFTGTILSTAITEGIALRQPLFEAGVQLPFLASSSIISFQFRAIVRNQFRWE